MTASTWRKVKSAIFVGFCGLSIAVALVPLAFILFFVLKEGLQALDYDFFTQMPQPVGETGGGMANAIVGTLIIVGLGALFAIPTGIMSGVYLSEYAGTRLASAARFAADTLNGVPSIVIGMFIYTIAVLPVKQFSALAGGLALGVMMIPIIARTTEELLLLVPGSMREGALALGATRAQATFTRGAAGRAPGHSHRRRAGAGAHRRGNGAAALHGVQQPLLQHHAHPADRVAHGDRLHLRHLTLRGLAPPGVGRRARAGRHRLLLLAAGPGGHPPPRKDAGPVNTAPPRGV